MEQLEQWELITNNSDSETIIYRVFDPRLQQRMCVKSVFFNSFEEATKGCYEASNQMRLKSAHVCQVHSFQLTIRKQRFVLEIEMELLECDGREAIRRRNGQGWSEGELLCLLNTLVGVLAQGQRHNLSHRDIKTANLLFDRDGQIKLADFGSSKSVEGQALGLHTGQGTPGFLSPLLSKWHHRRWKNPANSPKLSHNVYKSDVYSLGVSLLCFAKLLVTPPYPPFTSILESLPYPKLSLVLEKMTKAEEGERPDFIELERLLEIQPELCQVDPEKPLEDFLRTLGPEPVAVCAQCSGALGTTDWQRALSAELTQYYAVHLNYLCSLHCLESYTHNYKRMAQPCLLNSAHSFGEDRVWQRAADVVGSPYVYLLLSICSRACWDQFIEGLRSGEIAICLYCTNGTAISDSTPALECGCHFCSADCFRAFLEAATQQFSVRNQLTCPFDQAPISPDQVSRFLRDNWPRTAFGVYSRYCLHDLTQTGLYRLPCGLHYCCASCMPLIVQHGRRCWLCEPSA